MLMSLTKYFKVDSLRENPGVVWSAKCVVVKSVVVAQVRAAVRRGHGRGLRAVPGERLRQRRTLPQRHDGLLLLLPAGLRGGLLPGDRSHLFCVFIHRLLPFQSKDVHR